MREKVGGPKMKKISIVIHYLGHRILPLKRGPNWR